MSASGAAGTGARWLPAPEAASALAAAGTLSPRAVRRFARHDRVADIRGVAVACELLAPPAVSRPTVRLHAVDPSLPADPARLARAVQLARSLAPHARVQLRAVADPPADVLAAAGLAPFTLWIRKRPAAAAPVPGAEVRYAREEEDWRFVAECHRQALRNGMPTTAFGDEELDRYVHGALRIGGRGGPEALVCRIDGRRSGQVTWRTALERWSAKAVIDVVDVFVLPGQLKGPTGAALTAALEREVRARRPGLELLGNIVAEDGHERQVLQRLAAHGWQLDHELWQLA